MKQLFRLVHDMAKKRAIAAIEALSLDGWIIEIREATRTLEQNAKFHAMCGDIAKSPLQWAGKRRTARQWKVLLVSGHAVVTNEASEIIPGLEGEFINIRESTALMSKRRGSSLIEYTLAFGTKHEVKWSDEALEPVVTASPNEAREAA